MPRGRTVVVGVSGGIAAYKVCELVRWLKLRGASVIVAMTRAATEFVTPLTFQTLSGNPVVRDLWGDQAPGFDLPPEGAARIGGRVEHVDVAEAADAIVIAPATADLIARLVHGEAPDALTAIVLASRAPLVVCPAMDLEMWRNAATRENVRVLRARGATIVGPESGPLASGLEGPGRLAEIESIGAAIESALVRRRSMEGMKVLVGAGRTEEPLDPVRVLTNRSSGRMGYALAAAARDRGAEVTLVSGPASVDAPDRVSLVRVQTAIEMERAMAEPARAADLVVMAAAVADYRPRARARGKIARRDQPLTLELEPNPDILSALAAKRRPSQVFVGFALETTAGIARARAKLAAKGVDLIVMNGPETIGRDTNRATLVEAKTVAKLPALDKRELAETILDRALELKSGAAKRGARGSKASSRPRRGPTRRALSSPSARPAARPRLAARAGRSGRA